MNTTVQSGPARVIDSGSATAFSGHPITLTIPIQGAMFAVTFQFESTEAGDLGIRTETSTGAITIVCENFDSADGRGSSDPVLLGEAGEHLLWMHFRVFRYGRTQDRTVHYTFFDVPKADVGWKPTG